MVNKIAPIAAVAIVVIVVAVAAFILMPQGVHQPGLNNSTSTTTSSTQSLGQAGQLSVGQSATFSSQYSEITVSLIGISSYQGGYYAVLNITSGQYALKNEIAGPRQYLSLGQNSGIYLLVYQVSGSSATVNVTSSIPSGFTAAPQSNYGPWSNSSAGGGSNGGQPGLASLGACGASSTFLTATPLSSVNYTNVIPLGWMSPGGHVLPSDHVYFQITTPGTEPPNVTVIAPGNVTIYQVDAKTYSTGQSDYSIYFAQCSNVTFFIHHLESVTRIIASNLTASGSVGCQNSTANGATLRVCSYSTDIKVRAGEKLGTVGGFPTAAEAIDLGATDYRTTPLVYANDSRYSSMQLHMACPVNYFTSSLQSAIYARIGLGSITRTSQPLCGTNDQDMPGTAQGNWFSAHTPTPYINEGLLMSLVHDNLITNEEVFSVGDSAGITGMAGVTLYFNYTESGTVNRDFGSVTADGQVYCYGSLSSSYSGSAQNGGQGSVLLQLVNANTLKIEHQGTESCGSGPWTFTSNATTFYR